ncbi:MAG TPA: glycosyltransferase family 25 protein [Roseiarcus sp.]|jgi:glycosyl transferase family 25
MKIYLINLDRDSERLAHMRKQLNGVAFERISAVDGSNDAPTTKGLSRFELACLESHKLAWRQFLNSPEDRACFLEDDLHIWPGVAALTGSGSWIPSDAHSVKLDTYRQKVELGEKQVAVGERQIARLYSRHQSSAAYILTREGAARYLDLTARASLPADYALFPNHPRRLGLRIYQLCPAIAIQDHLLEPNEGGQAFTTAMAATDGSATLRRSSTPEKLRREGVRLAGQVAGLMEWTYQKAVLGLETTTVGVG